jgi:hypothetical protein
MKKEDIALSVAGTLAAMVVAYLIYKMEARDNAANSAQQAAAQQAAAQQSADAQASLEEQLNSLLPSAQASSALYTPSPSTTSTASSTTPVSSTPSGSTVSSSNIDSLLSAFETTFANAQVPPSTTYASIPISQNTAIDYGAIVNEASQIPSYNPSPSPPSGGVVFAPLSASPASNAIATPGRIQ